MDWLILKWLLLGIFTNSLILSEANINIEGVDRCRLFHQAPCGHSCVPLSWLCDGDEDCPGGVDERCEYSKCGEGKIQCSDNTYCIDEWNLCDGKVDCSDGSDEVNCLNKTCLGMQCRNQRCILKTAKCNGVDECGDNSDEELCEAEHEVTCAEYRCSNKCLSEHEICDGILDCIDGTDEPESCGKCWDNNGGCSILCEETIWGAHCACPAGMILQSDGKHCFEGTTSILTAGSQSLGILDLNSRSHLSIGVAENVVAITFDQAKSIFYWVDVKGTIFSLAENSSSPIYTDAKGVTSIAVDWFTGLIFWTNHLEEKICAGLSNGNGFVTILEKNVRPEQLVLFPGKSCMFWVNQRDNTYSKVHIETAGMDGSGREVAVVLDSVKPIGLTLDYPVERLYWFNKDHETVETAKIDGSERFSLFGLDIKQPQGFSTFEGWFYWSVPDRVLRTSYKRQKEVLLEPALVSILAITHQHPNTHQCQNAECSHICLLSPVNIKGYKCACPRGTFLVSGKCDGNRSMCTTNNGGCSKYDICVQHINGVYCICPADEDCSLDTWEVQQDSSSTLQCERTFFLCEDGTECVSLEYKCDGDQDCPDGSDEIGCSDVCDEPDSFQCLIGTSCVRGELRCDGIEHCPDGSDEMNCMEVTDTCGFWCDDHQRCIPSDWLCDGSHDCTDETDEFGCGCGSDDFSCGDGQCVSLAFRCDLKYDCRDHSDEHNCPKLKKVPCKSDEVMCPVSKECIIKEWWCDDYMDCEDGMDEQNCKLSEVKCREFQWSCRDHSQCIPDFWHCDGQKDCKDGSDEINCQPRPCRSSEFQCTMLECINMSLACNEENDCADGSDEGGSCNQTCNNCTHMCYKTPRGPKCGCESGFKLMTDLSMCVDVDECKELPTRPCNQICLNMNGTYHCNCHTGFLLHHDGHSCKVTGAEPVLLVSIQHDIVLYGLHSAKKEILPAIAKNAIFSMDYDQKEKVVFWVDTYSESIKWMKLDQQDKGTLIKGIQSDCIAVDWLGRHLYWTDGVAGCILAANLDLAWNGPRNITVVVDTAVDQPHSLVLQPLNGLMYWAEIGSEPHIERAGMDGTNRKLLVKSGLGWPTSLTLDLIGRKLLWADGKLHCIGVANLDGTDIKLFQLLHTRRPFAVAVFEDEIYWSDVELRTVQKADRLGKNRTVLLKRNVQPYGLKVMHEVLQPQSLSQCDKMGCKHFCLLGPGLKGSCRCGQGMLLADDGVTCMKSADEPFLLVISPTVLTLVYLKHLQPDTGLKALPEHNVHQLLNNQVSSADFIWKDKLVYFTDSEEGLIGKFILGSNVSSDQVIFQVNDIISVSVDWLSGNLYWITSFPSVIEVASANGSYRLVLIENLYRPTSLALHPPTGIMCFADWGSEDQRNGPRIECSNMDGQKRKVLWKKCHLPTGLLLADSGTRLYWIDLDHNVIDSVLVDGSEFREVQAGLQAQSVFTYGENILFWTTVHNGYTRLWYSVMGQKQQWFEVEQNIVGLKVYSGQQQQGYNFCSEKNGGCNHLCLAYPGGRTCRCSTGYQLNGSNCEVMQCLPEAWQCHDGLSCILNEYVCDGEKHCADGSDENECYGTRMQSDLTTHVLPSPSASKVSPSTQEHLTTSEWFPSTATSYTESQYSPHSNINTVSTTASHGVSLQYVNISAATENFSTDQMGDFRVTKGAGRSSSCTAEMCNMRGRCYIVNDLVMCKCQEGYTGKFCEDQAMPGLSVLLILGILILVLLVGIGTIIYKKRATKRRARANLQLTAAGQGSQTFRNEAFIEVPEEPRTSS